MGPLRIDGLEEGALLLLDSAPIIYYFEDFARMGARYDPLFRAQEAGRIRFAVTPITIAEVLTGPFRVGDETTARRYRAALGTWEFVALTPEIADGAARLRASLQLKLPDALQVASALAINAAALVTSDRDFSRVPSPRIIS